ncbi:MAG: helix-turn-helix transcriptional regulator [Firmicutes bacterium]|nr:helix-turn-helix transcriptional regulator [Bacillota bacterium]
MLEEKAGYLDDMPMNIRIMNIRNYPLHYHYDHEFIYVLRGSVVLKCGSSIYQMQQGDIFIINDSEVHGIYDCSDDNIVLMIQIDAEYFSRRFPTLPFNVYRTMGTEKSNEEIIVLRNLLLKIAFNDMARRPGYQMTNINIMTDVLSYCDQYFKSFYFEGKIVMHKKYDYPEMGERLGRIIDYIYEHHDEKLTLRELARKEHFSEGYMSKLITAGTGLGFRELLAFARVEESERILLSGSEKVSSIAAKVGFSTTAYYEKFFEKWFQCRPEEYRKIYAGRIKGNAAELVFELNKEEAAAILRRSIRSLAFGDGAKAGPDVKHYELALDAAQEKTSLCRKNIISESPGDELGYAMESVLAIPYMVKGMLAGRQFRIPEDEIYTPRGIPKPLFDACRVVRSLEGDLLSSGPCHVVARSADGKRISILLFNTSPDLEELCQRKCSVKEVREAIDRFAAACLTVETEVCHLKPGMYQIIESTYSHRDSRFCLACDPSFDEREMTEEEVMTEIEIAAPQVKVREEYLDGKTEFESDLRGPCSKLIRIIRKQSCGC